MRKDLKSAFLSEVRGVVARFFTALRFVLNDGEGGFGMAGRDALSGFGM
jgi:hypothetical protein